MNAQDLIKKLRYAIRKGHIKGTSEIGAIIFNGETTEVVKLDTIALPMVVVNELSLETNCKKVDIIFYDSNIYKKGRRLLYPGTDVELSCNDDLPKSTDSDEDMLNLLMTKE